MSRKFQSWPLIALALVALLALAACSSGAGTGGPSATSAPATSAAPQASKKIKVGLQAASLGWPWYATFVDTFKARAAKEGWDLVLLGANGDVATQQNQIKDLISQKPDYLLIGPIDPKAVVPGIKEAHDANIPVVVYGNTADKEADQYIVTYVGPDDYDQGKNSIEMLVQALNGKGTVAIVEGLPGQPAVINRERAYDDVLKNYPDIKIVAKQPADWDSTKAVAVTEDLLTRYPDLNAILSEDGSMTPGIVQVAKDAKKNLIIVGLGGTGNELKLVKDGVVYGTTCMGVARIATAVADTVAALIRGDKVEKVNIVPSPKTTKDNANQCPGDW